MMRNRDIRCIGLLCSGGDAPGMNAGVRAVVRTAVYNGVRAMGILDGYNGLVRRETRELGSSDVSGLLQRGGSILGSGRCKEFFDAETREACVAYLRSEGIEGIVALGGDGTLAGAGELHQLGFPVVVIPATIDNDMPSTDMTIGTDTALSTAVEAIDRLNDTASAHGRAMIVEVMGRHSGYLAVQAGIATGVEMIITPERPIDLQAIFDEMAAAERKGKDRFIIVLAEGAQWHASELTQLINDAENPYDARFTILGYIQRGGVPSRYDRTLATRMGVVATEAILTGESGVLVALQGYNIDTIAFDALSPRSDPWRDGLVHVHRIMAL